MSAPAPELMRSIIQRIATGPELSKDITREEAQAGMRLVLDGAVDPVRAGVFLIALRMKRETDEENLGLLEAVREATLRATAPVDEVLDLGDPYDGYVRTLPAAPFLPAVLAACGVPTVTSKAGLPWRHISFLQVNAVRDRASRAAQPNSELYANG